MICLDPRPHDPHSMRLARTTVQCEGRTAPAPRHVVDLRPHPAAPYDYEREGET